MAANPLEGEVDFPIAGDTYTLCFPSRAIVQVEQLFGGVSIGEIATKIAHVEYLAALMWSALQKHHSGVDLFGAYDLLDKCDGGVQAVAEPLARALRFRISRTPLDQPLVGEGEA